MRLSQTLRNMASGVAENKSGATSFAMALKIENVQDYPRPPALEQVADRLRVTIGGATLAETTRGWRVLETHHAPTYYIPQDDVDMTRLVRSDASSMCEWKGRAAYFDLVLPDTRVTNAAWCYPQPTARFADIAGAIAIYATAVDACYVGDAQVIPQPGNFYGGWVTPNLRGTVKGAKGTEGW